MLDNGFLRNKNLSLKARGLLATILSQRDDWDFSVRGFEAILPNGRAAIESTVKELENAGYISRLQQEHGEDGRMLPGKWDVHERPARDEPAMRGPPSTTNGRTITSGSDTAMVQKPSSEPLAGFPQAADKPN